MLTKGILPPALLDAGRPRRSGTPRAVGRGVFTSAEWNRIANTLELSARELQLIRALFDNEPELAIAQELGLTTNTVHTYFKQLNRKLGTSNHVGIVVRVVETYMAMRPPAP